MMHSIHTTLLLIAAVGTVSCAGASRPARVVDVSVTEHGGSSVLTATLERTAAWTRAGFSDLKIHMKEVERRPGQNVFRGTDGPMEITAELKSQDSRTTRVEVTARKKAGEWDPFYAANVLAHIVKRQK